MNTETDSIQARAADIMTMGRTRGTAEIIKLVQEAIAVVEAGYEQVITDIHKHYRGQGDES